MTDRAPSMEGSTLGGAFRRYTTRRRFMRAAATVGAITAGAGGGVVGTVGAQGIETPWLHRDGHLIKDPQDEKVVLRGVNVADPARLNDQDRRYHATAESVIEHATDADRGWYPRIIRLPCQSGDIAGAGSNEVAPGSFSRGDLEAYLEEHLRPAVEACAEHGVYCIVDYHRHDDSQLLYTDPELDDEVRMFWETIAPEFADDSHVLYEVYNEPIAPYAGHNQWDGDYDVLDPEAGEDWQAWKAAAQPWVDTIREHAPQNIVIIGSPRWTQYTYWAAQDEFDGDDLAYAGHVYAHPNLRPLSTYFGEPSLEVPVFMTEFGWEPDHYADYMDGTADEQGVEFREFFEEYDSVHWQVWCFDPRWAPVMFEEDQGEWTLLGDPHHGEFFRAYLEEKKDDDVPGGGDSNGDDGIALNGSRAQDLDGDGLHRDVNGNDATDFNDVVTFFEHMDDDAVQDNVDAFDFNGNGRIDFADVTALFETV